MPRQHFYNQDRYTQWEQRGICACGHPLSMHRFPKVDYLPPRCQGPAFLRQRQGLPPVAVDPEKDHGCRCMNPQLVALVPDTRYFVRSTPREGNTHPFNLAMDKAVARYGSTWENWVWEWGKPPRVCTYVDPETHEQCTRSGEGVRMYYVDPEKRESRWICGRHAPLTPEGGLRHRLLADLAEPGDIAEPE